MELLLADKLGFPKGFNGFEWSSLPMDGIKKKQMPSYLVEDLPNTDGFSIREKFKEVSFAEAPKIGYFRPFIKTNYEIFRKEQMQKDQVSKLKQKKKDQKCIKDMIKRDQLKQYSVDLNASYQNSYSEQVPNRSDSQQETDFARHYSVTPTKSSQQPNVILTLLKERMMQERKQKKENEKKKQQLIDDLHYYKIFADKNSRLTIECVDSISQIMGNKDEEEREAGDKLNEYIENENETELLNSSINNPQKNDILNSNNNYQSKLKKSIFEEDNPTSTSKYNNFESQNTANIFTAYKNSIQSQKGATSPLINLPRGIKHKSFLEADISKISLNQNSIGRGRNTSLFQASSSQFEKGNSSVQSNFKSRGSKRISLLNDYSSNRLQQTSISFFKGDETLYKTFQTGNKSSSKMMKNSYLQSTATSNRLNEQLNMSINQSLYQPENNNKQQLISPQYHLASTEICRNKNKSINSSKTPKAKGNIMNAKNNRFLTPQKRDSRIDHESDQNKETENSHNNNGSIQVKDIINQQAKDNIIVQKQFETNGLSVNKQLQHLQQVQQQQPYQCQNNNFFSTPQKNRKQGSILLSPNLQYQPHRNISPSPLNQSQIGDYSIHSQMRSKRGTQFENIDRDRDCHIDPDYLTKQDSHHKSIMYAMKTLKKKFGLLNNKFDPQTAMM